MGVYREVRWKSILRLTSVITAFSLFIYVFFNSSDSHSSSIDDSPFSDAFSRRIPLQLQRFCGFQELPVHGDEGSFMSNSLKLRGIAVVFRHGERSPLMENFEDLSGCAPYREEDRREFDKYVKMVSSEEGEYFLRTHPEYSTFPLVPHRPANRIQSVCAQLVNICRDGPVVGLSSRSHCKSGEMTAEGALQQWRLGQFMNDRYGLSSIFAEEYRLNVSVQASPYHRTFQSAIAFSFGFFRKHTTQIPQIYINHSPFTYLCKSPVCSCPIAADWRKKYENEIEKEFLHSGPKKIRQMIDVFRSVYNNSDSEPLKLMDTVLGRNVCRRRPLPCTLDGKCITYDFFDELLAYVTKRSDRVYDKGAELIAQRLYLLEAFGPLYHLVEEIQRLKKFPHTNVIKVFSGHDVTVWPLAKVLGLSLSTMPYYTTRIVFEIYSDQSSPSVEDSILIRVLYHGNDVTKEVAFCTILVHGLCPATAFEKFVRYDILQLMGSKSVQENCDKPF